MQAEDFQPEDLFGQIQALVDSVSAERQARQTAEAADKAKSELLAVVSHELRTPMGAVISMAELLIASPLEATQRRYAETLQQSARSLLSILNGILDFSKLEAGRFELDPAPFDVHELLQSLACDLQARASEKGLATGVDVGASTPRHVIGDAGRLRQILSNLIDNAVKFTSDGSVRLRVSSRDMDGRLHLRFDVTDTGIGLSREQQQRLFQPYVQVDRSVASKYGGTGLGLSIARRLVELMGGTISCESAVGQGSLFWCLVPAERTGESAAPAKETQAAPAVRQLSGHILVVEDNPVNRMLIGAYLDEFGLSYEMVDTGAEAIMGIASHIYDLVLMDIIMPELDGVETTRRIKSLLGPSAEVPIIALTANAMPGDPERYLAAGMDGYVSKPIRGRELHAALAPYLAVDEHHTPAAKAS